MAPSIFFPILVYSISAAFSISSYNSTKLLLRPYTLATLFLPIPTRFPFIPICDYPDAPFGLDTTLFAFKHSLWFLYIDTTAALRILTENRISVHRSCAFAIAFDLPLLLTVLYYYIYIIFVILSCGSEFVIFLCSFAVAFLIISPLPFSLKRRPGSQMSRCLDVIRKSTYTYLRDYYYGIT